jgi:hypothetical protein
MKHNLIDKKIKPIINEYYIDNKDLIHQIKLSHDAGKLTEQLKLYIFSMIDGVAKKHCFNGYDERINSLFTLYAYEMFNKYWKNFKTEVMDENGNKKVGNAFGYFTRLIDNAFFYVIKKVKEKEFNKTFFYDNITIDFINQENYEFYEEIFFEMKSPIDFEYKDVIYDYSEVTLNILNNLNKISSDTLNYFLSTSYHEREIGKVIRSDKSLMDIIKIMENGKN